MSNLRNYLNKIKPHFEEGGNLHPFKSFFEGMETFLYVPNSTSKTGVHIHDAIDSKRIMSVVVRTICRQENLPMRLSSTYSSSVSLPYCQK